MKIDRTPEFKDWFEKQTEKSKAQIDSRLKNIELHDYFGDHKSLGEKSLKEKPLAENYSPGEDVSIEGLKEAITEALFEADYDTFKGCIAILLDKYDYQDIVQKTGLSKTTLYRMCEPTSNPTLENIGKVLNYINELGNFEAA